MYFTNIREMDDMTGKRFTLEDLEQKLKEHGYMITSDIDEAVEEEYIAASPKVEMNLNFVVEIEWVKDGGYYLDTLVEVTNIMED